MKSALMTYVLIAFSISVTAYSASPPSPPSPKLTAEELQKKMIQTAYTKSEESIYVMKLVNSSGTETVRKMRVWFKRDGEKNAKLLMKFQEPADIRGTALLSVVDDNKTDQWLYLPKLKKTRRIKGGNENESFLGSDFTVGDLTSLDNDKNRYTYTVTASDKKCGDTVCYVLTGLPQAGVDAEALAYSKKVVEVRADNFMGSRVELFNNTGKLEKVMQVSKDRMEMKNLINNTSTVIELQKRDSSKAPADSLFTQSNLERG